MVTLGGRVACVAELAVELGVPRSRVQKAIERYAPGTMVELRTALRRIAERGIERKAPHGATLAWCKKQTAARDGDAEWSHALECLARAGLLPRA